MTKENMNNQKPSFVERTKTTSNKVTNYFEGVAPVTRRRLRDSEDRSISRDAEAKAKLDLLEESLGVNLSQEAIDERAARYQEEMEKEERRKEQERKDAQRKYWDDKSKDLWSSLLTPFDNMKEKRKEKKEIEAHNSKAKGDAVTKVMENHGLVEPKEEKINVDQQEKQTEQEVVDEAPATNKKSVFDSPSKARYTYDQ